MRLIHSGLVTVWRSFVMSIGGGEHALCMVLIGAITVARYVYETRLHDRNAKDFSTPANTLTRRRCLKVRRDG